MAETSCPLHEKPRVLLFVQQTHESTAEVVVAGDSDNSWKSSEQPAVSYPSHANRPKLAYFHLGEKLGVAESKLETL